MEIKNTLVLGHRKNERVKLPWMNSNGLLIAGVPGTGKSTTASYYIHQYVFKGTRIVLCDYNASLGTGETLLHRIKHLEPMYLMQPATTKKDIADRIYAIQKLGDDRYSGRQRDHFPILFVIDEFPAFLYDFSPPQITNTKVSGDKKSTVGETKIVEKAPDFIEALTSGVWKFRKVNIHFMLIGQDWAQAGTNGVRKLRSNITDKVIHRVDESQSSLFGFGTREEQQTISRLPTGVAVYKGSLGDDLAVRIPELTDEFVNAVIEKIQDYDVIRLDNNQLSVAGHDHFTFEELQYIQEMMEKYSFPSERIQRQVLEQFSSRKDFVDFLLGDTTIETREDLIKLLILAGKTDNWIITHVKGKTADLAEMIKKERGKTESGHSTLQENP